MTRNDLTLQFFVVAAFMMTVAVILMVVGSGMDSLVAVGVAMAFKIGGLMLPEPLDAQDIPHENTG